MTIGNATLAQAITIDSGAGAINIGNSATGKTITIGSATGTGALNMYAGTGNFILDGAGGTTYSFGSSTTTGTFTMGGSAQTGTANLFTGTGAMTLNIGTGASAKAITLGNTDTTTSVTINSGTGGISLLTGTTGNLSLKTGTTGAVTLDSGTTGAVSIGTGANAKAITIGSATSGTTLSLTGGATWSLSTAGTLTTSGNISLTSTTPTISVGNTGTLAFTDGTNTLLSVVDKGTYATLRLSDKGIAGDPATCNAGEIYFNDTDNTVKACTSANTWEQLDNGADAQNFVSYDTSEALTNVTTAETQIATLSVTPSTTTGDVYVRGLMEIVSGNNTNHTITFTVEKGGTTCADSTVLETNTIAITSANGVTIGAFELADIDVDPGTTAVTYRLCSITSAVDSDVRLYSFMAMVVDNGADLAEIYSTSDESLQAGDLVSLDPLLSVGVKKSSEKYDRALFGVVSTWPGMVIGGSNGEGVKAIPVALSGRVPVKVNTENGDIKAGDLLTSSSTPGVAMKASKAGSVIAQAMTNYSGDEAGTVLAFIKNGGSNGATLAEVMSGLDQTSGTYSFDVLTNIILQKDQINTDSTNISEIFTDRVVAGLEIITPKITTENLLVKGEATFSGILYADTIKANRIEGVDILTRKLSLLSDQVAGVATSAGEVQEILTEINILEIISSKIAEVFMNTVEFLGKVVFRGDVNFAGRPTFNKDTAGFATIKAGGSEVEVLFAREYATEPVVTATVQIAGGASVADVPGYAIADVNTRGFMIRMSRGVGMDLRFAWMALAVSGTSVFEGDGGVVITTTPTQAPESTPEPVVSISPETTPEIPEATPAAIVVPTPTSIPEITPTEEASKSGDL